MRNWFLPASASFITIFSLSAILVAACGGTSEQPPVNAATYEAEQLACVDHATTRAEADACRNEVKRRYGRDAGK